MTPSRRASRARRRPVRRRADPRRTSRSSHQEVHGKPLVYLDNAATAQKPQAVIDAHRGLLRDDNANVHRGVHQLSERATDAYEGAREKVQRFLNAAQTPRDHLRARHHRGDQPGRPDLRPRVRRAGRRGRRSPRMEHHSNIVPWQMLCEEKGARLRVAPIDDAGELRLDEYERLLGARTRLVAVAHVSNALGTVDPGEADDRRGRTRRGVPVLVDGAQAVPHLPVDVQALDCDFYAFSGPQGLRADRHRRALRQGRAARGDAALPGRRRHDPARSPSRRRPTTSSPTSSRRARRTSRARSASAPRSTTWTALGLERIAAHEHELLAYGTERLARIPGLRLIGTAREKAGVLSFVLDGVAPARRRHDPGPRGHRRPRRPPLRAAGDAALRRAGHRAGLARLLQHARGDRRARARRSRKVREIFG